MFQEIARNAIVFNDKIMLYGATTKRLEQIVFSGNTYYMKLYH